MGHIQYLCLNACDKCFFLVLALVVIALRLTDEGLLPETSLSAGINQNNCLMRTKRFFIPAKPTTNVVSKLTDGVVFSGNYTQCWEFQKSQPDSDNFELMPA